MKYKEREEGSTHCFAIAVIATYQCRWPKCIFIHNAQFSQTENKIRISEI